MAIVEMKAVLAYVTTPSKRLPQNSLFIRSALINRFEFEPAYEGQVAHPTAMITMSKF